MPGYEISSHPFTSAWLACCMFVHVRQTGGGDVSESLLLGEGAGKIWLGKKEEGVGVSVSFDQCLK